MKKFSLYLSRIFLALLLLIGSASQAQEMLGVAFSPYSSLSSATINPAMLTGSRVFMEVNLVSANVSADNNFLYYTSGIQALTEIIINDTTYYKSSQNHWSNSLKYHNTPEDKYFLANVHVKGPSAMIQTGKHAFGFTTAFRSFHSGNHIPVSAAISSYEGISFPDFQDVEFNEDEYSMASMSWSEVGLTYAYDISDRYYERLTFGVTAKALFGYEGGYSIIRHSNYTIYDGRSVDFKNLDAEFGYALPISSKNELATDFGPMIKGYGVGFDFGLVFTKLKSDRVYKREDKICAKPYKDYWYKIGLSVLDIGGISFSNDAETHSFDNVSKNWADFDTIHFRGIHEAVGIYSQGFYGDPNESYTGDKFTINLPATVSLQIDAHLQKNLYLSALWMHPLKFNGRTLWRPAQLAVIPRYEHSVFGISMPVSVFNYSDLRLGLAVRFMYVTIGTDRIGALLGTSNFEGMDIYFSFRFNILKGACGNTNWSACTNSKFGNDW